ncbi:COG3650 family protein [Synechococcus sp. PCC 6312]|uniref:COG3650 family protein n=1 Tax=Synechococcus sp. (strain ATCC 27167 / PCC 6312) TaxID=195253 RepID=UPI00029F04D2|nr:hypothetical protein [Synechococcus sp. PCC 6312]AFY59380.1 putative membrane protein [Synechococcus sp. PCC 6312]
MLQKRWLALIVPMFWLGFTLEGAGGTGQLKLPNSQSPSKPELVAERSPAWQFRAFGTEPFWGVNITPSGIAYSTPAGTQAEFPYVRPLYAAGRPEELVLFFNLGKTNSLTLIQTQCSDGMSDQTHLYRAIFVFNNRVYDGCANPRASSGRT